MRAASLGGRCMRRAWRLRRLACSSGRRMLTTCDIAYIVSLWGRESDKCPSVPDFSAKITHAALVGRWDRRSPFSGLSRRLQRRLMRAKIRPDGESKSCEVERRFVQAHEGRAGGNP